MTFCARAVPVAVFVAASPVFAQTPAPVPSPSPTPPTVSEYVEVTATRVPEETIDVPASVTVLTAQDLRDMGATDLPTALRFAAGIDMAPGGDAGPAASVPEIWGLREFDSVLLVVDGVPRSGAWVPDFESIDFADVERIEVLRGPAPVTFGATSFNGVIHVVRREAGGGHQGRAEAFGGSYGTGGVRLVASLPALGGLRSSLALDGTRQGTSDPRAGFGFKGVEAQAAWRVRSGLSLRGAWSWHDARFRDYVTEFDGVPTQLAGHRLEMSPGHIASAGVLWAPERGLVATLAVRYVGDRYLNKRNTAVADGYTTVDAGLGWRAGRLEVRLDGQNLTDERPPVAESELGDAQYYLLPARRIRLGAAVRF